jgi:uncharacterized Zn finger protein
MLCGECGNQTKYEEEFINLHKHLNVWTCDVCGIIKTELVVDGEIMRRWNKWTTN